MINYIIREEIIMIDKEIIIDTLMIKAIMITITREKKEILSIKNKLLIKTKINIQVEIKAKRTMAIIKIIIGRKIIEIIKTVTIIAEK